MDQSRLKGYASGGASRGPTQPYRDMARRGDTYYMVTPRGGRMLASSASFSGKGVISPQGGREGGSAATPRRHGNSNMARLK